MLFSSIILLQPTRSLNGYRISLDDPSCPVMKVKRFIGKLTYGGKKKCRGTELADVVVDTVEVGKRISFFDTRGI